MTDQDKIFAVHLGIFASPRDRDRLLERGVENVSSIEGVVVRNACYASAEEAAALDSDLTVSDLYAELPEQWRDEHPGKDPGRRETGEIRITVVSRKPDPQTVMDALAHVACPSLEHAGPCPVPWSADFIEDDDDASSAEYLHSVRSAS